MRSVTRIILFICLNLFIHLNGRAQFGGLVLGDDGEPLPFASVYLRDGSKGTMTNAKGVFELDIPKGDYEFVIQYTGYEKKILAVQYTGGKEFVKVQLIPASLQLAEVVFSAKKEDPAYEIIRKAIQNRKRNGFSSIEYKCRSYSKGMFKILDAPEKILGQSLGNLGGNLDSNRQGVIYLSEAVSEIQFIPPDYTSEKMIASKVAGSDNGFSMNWASAISLNLYDNVADIGKGVISPIADYALGHYRYRLEGILKDVDSITYFRIKVWPRVPLDAVWSGYVYITEQDYSIYGFNGYVLGTQVKQEFFDTIFLRQEFSLLHELKARKVQTQVFQMNANFLGVRVTGNFSLSFSDFQFGEKVEKLKKRSEVYEVLKGANNQNSSYWDSVRTIPLTEEEVVNYQIKDSLKAYRNSKDFLDSMDNLNNRLRSIDLLTGYSYTKTNHHLDFTTNSLLDLVSFNPVQGVAFSPVFIFQKYFGNKFGYNKLMTFLKADYGVDEDRLRLNGGLGYYFNQTRKSFFKLNIGNRLRQYHSGEGVNKLFNTYSCLINKRNFFKAYDEKYISFQFESDLNYSNRLIFLSRYSGRTDVSNHSDYSIRFYNKNYEDNLKRMGNPEFFKIRMPVVWMNELKWRIQPFTRVWKTPEGIQKLGSDWPELFLSLETAYYPKSKVNFSYFRLNINDSRSIGRIGEFGFQISYSQRLNKSQQDVPEYFYTDGIPFSFYPESFQAIPYLALRTYQVVAQRQLLEFKTQWNMGGLILDRIPWVSKLRFEELVQLKTMIYDGTENYTEMAIGLGNVGYRFFRIFNIYLVKTLFNGVSGPLYGRVGITGSF